MTTLPRLPRARCLSAAHAVAISLLSIGAASRLSAQDTRDVKEPVVPPSCVALPAALMRVGDSTVTAADETKLDTPRIQQAIDGCGAGKSVHLAADGPRRAFVSGPIQLKPGVTLVVDSGVTLFASRDPRLFDITPNACGRLTTAGRGCYALVRAERADHSGVMGPGTIDGRGWAMTLGGTSTWWEMAEQARDTKYSQNNPRLIVTSRSNDFTLYRLTLRNSPNFHVVLERGDGMTAWGVTINTPKGARNTDGIDPSGSQNVSILHSNIHTGDDNIAIKAGTNGGAKNMTIAHNHFYNGHGVSIGSETDGGASAILVRDVTFEGTDNALRIKSNGSRGGLVDGVTYENVCVKNVKYPIYMDTHYSASPELDGAKTPQFRNITVRDTRIIGAGTVMLDGYDAQRPLGITFDRVVADQPARIVVKGGNTQLTIGAGGSNVVVPDSVARSQTGTRAPTLNAELARCEQRLVPFPGGAAKPVEVRKLAPPPPPTTDAAYTNPVLSADFSDPDVIRNGNDFWMTASSFGHVPGLPILHSTDLVHWQIVNYAIPRFSDSAFNVPQHGNGVWAPSIRQHDGWFWIFYGDPDRGIYMTKSRDPRGAWTAPLLVQGGKGLIDPSPLWDDDGKAYLVHAYARSRSGIKHKLVVHGMRTDGTALLDSGTLIFEDSLHHPTAEGPKFYQANGWYWIFAPAGGVSTGWQLAMRARSPRGPFEARTVMSQGASAVNGPHQGAWISLAGGEDWFLHFQDRGAYGRIVHLQPLTWHADGWPVIGAASANDTVGVPVTSAPRPRVASITPSPALQTSDEFSAATLGLQWQWQANPRADWVTFNPTTGWIRLSAQPLAAPARSLWNAPNLLLQKFPAEQFEVLTRLVASSADSSERYGVVVFGRDYAWLGMRRLGNGWQLVSSRVRDADKGTAETVEVVQSLASPDVQLRVRVSNGGICHFAFSVDGASFTELPAAFTAREGTWVGAKFGVFASRDGIVSSSPSARRKAPGAVQVDYVRVRVL